MTENKKVIILNKPFIGNWLNDDANIGHEIIDFVKADDGKYYVYNSPYGSCPKNIRCPEDEQANEKYTAEYMILTGPSKKKDKGSSFDVLYVIKLKNKLPTKEVPDPKKIKYGEVCLEEIYPDTDTSLFATFEASEIYEAINPIRVNLNKYNFQRNHGYVYSVKNNNDYNEDYNEFNIEGWIDKKWLRQIKLNKLKNTPINNNKTFLDLIHLENNEQVFTNIMHSILSHGNLLQLFVNKFTKTKKYKLGNVNVESEKNIDGGRCDVYATCENNVVIIENKVFSGLNGIEGGKSQLSTYYKYAKESAEPICFITVPYARMDIIKKEIQDKDANMYGVYNIVTYIEIADFIEKNKNVLKTWDYYSLVDDIINAFKNLSKLTKLDIYAQKFSNKVQSITCAI